MSTAPIASSNPSDSGGSVVFIDSRISNLELVVASLAAGTRWVLIDSEQDGLTQIAAALQGAGNLQSIQVLSHGGPGSLLLGSGSITSNTLQSQSVLLASIGAALAPQGDLLLYGCNVAQGDTGAQFIALLAQLTGADVAASSDLTGDAALGGDWVLEVNTGVIETNGFSLTPQASEALGVLATVEGTSGNDTLNGTVSADTITGLAGDDSILGDDGNDSIDGGEGNDILEGNAGDDVLKDDFGNSTMYGGLGNDTLSAMGQSVSLDGGDGSDRLIVSGSSVTTLSPYLVTYILHGSATLIGGAGDDSLETPSLPGQSGLSASYMENALLQGGDGHDRLQVSSTRGATLEGGAGQDTLTSTNFLDGVIADQIGASRGTRFRFDGGADNDTLSVSGMANTYSGLIDIGLEGGAGDDSLTVYDGSSAFLSTSGAIAYATLSGGDGDDTLTASGVLQLTLTGGAGSDTFALTGIQQRTIQRVYSFTTGTSPTTASLTVNGKPIVITDFTAGAGGDVIDLSDLLATGTSGYTGGNPFGASGYLYLQQSMTNPSDTVLLFDADGVSGTASTWLPIAVLNGVSVSALTPQNFSPLFDSIISPLPPPSQIIVGTALADSLIGGDLGDSIDGLGGNDTIYGADGDDLIDGGDGNDSLGGNAGNDSINGSAGNDSIHGGDGNDTLIGGFGNDSLWGNAGNDLLIGGTGNDFFYPGDGADTIDGSPVSKLWWPISAADSDTLSYTNWAPSGTFIDLSARTVSVIGQSGVDSFSGIENIWGASNAPDVVTGRLTSGISDYTAGGSSIVLTLFGGSDTVSLTGYGYQQPDVDGVTPLSYGPSATGINVSYSNNVGRVSYGAAGSQLAGTDTVFNVGFLASTRYSDVLDMSGLVTNHYGYITAPLAGNSFNMVFVGYGGSDTVIGNGQTWLYFGSTNSSTGSGVNIDLRLTSADLSHLSYSSGGVTSYSGTLTYSGINGLYATAFNDTLIGSDKDDLFRGYAGNDLIDGGQGFDRADYKYTSSASTFLLATGLVSTANEGQDTLRSIENIAGTSYGDVFDATGFESSTQNIGSYWWGYNGFVEAGGSDLIIGNGATLLDYGKSLVAIDVDLMAGYADARLEADKSTILYSTMGRDTLSGVFYARGSVFDDRLSGGGLGNTLQGSAYESFRGGAGHDTIDGRSGWDNALYDSSPEALVVDMRLATGQVINDGWGFTDTLVDIEGIVGTAYNDSVRGSDSSTARIRFSGSKGNDSFDGGAGTATIGFQTDEAGAYVRLSGWVGSGGSLPTGFTGSAIDGWGTVDVFTNVDNIEGSNFNDTLIGDANSNAIDGRGGSDSLDGGLGIDTLEFNQAMQGIRVSLLDGQVYDDGQGIGNAAQTAAIEVDTITGFENVSGGYGNDSIIGDAGSNVLQGNDGDDSLFGGAGGDRLDGNAGDDSLYGEDGNDALYGGAGNDLLSGGLGNDTFTGGEGSDTIIGSAMTSVPWPVYITDFDVLRIGYSGSQIDLSARTVSVVGEAGIDSYSGIEEIHGGINATDIVTGRTSDAVTDYVTEGSRITLRLFGGSDTVSITAYGYQQPFADGARVNYDWSATGIHLSSSGNVATVAYGGIDSQIAGIDSLVNVGLISGTSFDDLLDTSGLVTNQWGYFTRPAIGKSWTLLYVGDGGSDTIIGNGHTFVAFDQVSSSSNGLGLSFDLRAGTANASHLSGYNSWQGLRPLGTTTFSGVDGISGTRFADTLVGGIYDEWEWFRGNGGNDLINGGSGFDRADYTWASAGMTFNLLSGVFSSVSEGQDTVRGIEEVKTTRFDDTFNASGFVGGFTSTVTNIGSFAWGLNAYVESGGNDIIIGNGNTRIEYTNSLVAIEADLAAGFVDARIPTDKASDLYKTLGRDTVSGVYAIRGSAFDDLLQGGGSGGGELATPYESFRGEAGNDTIDGRAGVDLAEFGNSPNAISVNLGLASAQVIQDGWGFSDTLISIENISGSHGNDSIVGDAGSNVLQGIGGDDTLKGEGGNDVLEGGLGSDVAVFNGQLSNYALSRNLDGSVSVSDLRGTTVSGFDGIDTLIGIETLRFSDGDIQTAPSALSGSVQISGTATQGQTLSATNTLIDLNGLGSITYQWTADGADIAGAISNTFTLTQNQVGKIIAVVASNSDSFGSVESVSSTSTAAVANVNDAPTGTVTVSGMAKLGQSLTASNTIADLDGMGPITYQWKADGIDIAGATSNTLALTYAQVGKAISVAASYTDGGGTLETVGSLPTALVVSEITGTSNPDSLVGGDLADSIYGLGGSDTIQGNGGDDSIQGGSGNDTIYCGAGNDTIDGGSGNDFMMGDAGDDLLIDYVGSDWFSPGDGNDVIDFGSQSRVPWAISTSETDQISYEFWSPNGTQIDLSARTVSVIGYSGIDTYAGAEQINGGRNTSDLITGRTSSSVADYSTGGSSIGLFPLGGSDTISITGYGYQQPTADGPFVYYHTMATGISISYSDNVGYVSYGASGTQIAGTDTITNVAYFSTTNFSDTLDLSGLVTNHLGFITDPLEGDSWNWLYVGLGGSDTVIGNGQTYMSFSFITGTSNGSGVNVDLRLNSADLSHLSYTRSLSVTNSSTLTTNSGHLTYSGVYGLVGTSFDDTLIGADTDDLLRGLGGNDSLDGGAGFDRADYRNSSAGITFNMASGLVSSSNEGQDTLRSIENIRGTYYDDVFDATGFESSTQNVGSYWWGYNGFLDLGGNDQIIGNGATRIDYSASLVAIDVDLMAGYADARLEADKSTILYSTMGRDTLSGVFYARGSVFDDRLSGGGLGNTLQGSAYESFRGGAGNDTIDGRGGWDNALYDSSPEALVVDMRLATGQVINDGWGFADTLIDVEGIVGTAYNDSVRGSDSSTARIRFSGSKGNDSFDGGAGTATIGFQTDEAGAYVRLSGWVGSSGALPTGFTGSAIDGWGTVDVFTNVDNIEGSNFNDTLIGDANNNVIDGRGGSDSLDGGLGIDTLEFNQAMQGIRVSLLDGRVYDDGQGIGNAAQTAAIEVDTITGFENVSGGYGNDSIIGDASSNVLQGNDGNDTLKGEGGDDMLEGGEGDDSLQGGQGDDVLEGGAGFDVAVFSGAQSNYAFLRNLNGSITVSDLRAATVSGFDGTDTLSDIETLRFGDALVQTDPAAPTGTVTISGNAAQGQTLSASTTLADLNGFGAIAYQWKADGVSILGATSTTLTLSQDQVGKAISLVASYTDASGTLEVVSSAVTSTVINIDDEATGTLSVTGTAQEGSALSASLTAINDLDGATTTAYRWQENTGSIGTPNWVDLAGATSATLSIPDDQSLVGRSVRVVATTTDTLGGTTEFAGDTQSIANVNDAPIGAVTISVNNGHTTTNLAQGDTLTASNSLTDADGIPVNGANAIAYQWKANGLNIVGATASSYVLTATEVGKAITVSASYVDNQGTSESVVSAASASVAPPPGLNLVGTSAANLLNGSTFNDTITGLGGNDTLNGLAGDDWLDGGTGNDSMVGSTGNDTYIVDSASDVIVEQVNQGTDLIRTALATYTLPTNVENLHYTGSAAFTGNGNTLNNAITGGNGADTLSGGAGSDTMTGGAGNDTYVVDVATDVIVELASGGTDTVRTALTTYTLGAELENLTYTGTVAFVGQGNELFNVLTGAGGADQLRGGSGNDTLTGGTGNDSLWGEDGQDSLEGGTGNDSMTGGAGDDTYVVDAAGDVLVELAAGGIDTVRTSLASYTLGTELENLVYTGTGGFTANGNTLANGITGAAGADNLSGLAGNDTLTGNNGNDTLRGGDGADVMSGGAGNDRYVYATIAESGIGALLRDLITDLSVSADRIDLSAIDANTSTGTNDAFTWRGTAAITAVGQLNCFYEAATNTTVIQGNVDANLAADFSIGVTGNLTASLVAATFVL